jgi:hypothetical protein
MGSSLGNIADNQFLVPWGHNEMAVEADASVPAPAGTAHKLLVATSDALEAGESVTIVVRRNGANTAITCTINAGQTACSDLVHSQAFVDGDQLTLRYDETGSLNESVKFTLLYSVN